MTDRIIAHIDPDLEALIPGFLDNRRKDVTRLGELISVADYSQIRLIGHSMKGVGGGYGFDPITDYGAVIEEGALRADAVAIAGAVAALADYLERVEPVFDHGAD